jgi:hypothetical protein
LAAFALTDVTPGEHQVTVRLRAGTPPDQVGSESQPTTVRLRTAEPLWLDFLQLSRPGRCEAEALPVYTQAMTPWIEDAAPLPDDPTSTQNVALRCATVPKESPLFVGLPALRDGRHRVALWLWPDSGVCHFQFQVNGQPVKDASVSALQPGAATDLGVIPLVKGTNLLTIVSDAWFRFDAADVVPCD